MPEHVGDSSNVAKIVADAMKVTSAALANWLSHPIEAENVVRTKLSLAVPNEVMCCCTMSVDVAIGNPRLSDAEALKTSVAGQLLLAWRLEEAAWLIDQSLAKEGTSLDTTKWGSLERSAISETSNVVGCEFLNAIAEGFRDMSGTDVSLMPGPPYIEKAYASGWMDAAIIEVEERGERKSKAWLATGTFPVADNPVSTHFAMVWHPDAWHRLTNLVGDAVDPNRE